jgi:tetratricopeptide (TPR) repeat protein
LYYKLDRDELARRHLNKAIEMDSGYQEALQLLAVVYDRIGQPELARDVLSQAAKTRVSGKRGKSRRREKAFNDLKPLPHGLINGADRRLSTAVREDALRAFSRTGSNGR